MRRDLAQFLRRARRVTGAALWLVLLIATSAAAQQPAPPVVSAPLAAVDPVHCWWRTSDAAVLVAQQFTLVLTCGVAQADGVSVEVDMPQLEPSAVRLTPFEVLAGVRHSDVEGAPRQYFQYEYTVRLVSSEFFGRDVNVPSLDVNYRIRTTAAGVEGRERVYRLPPLPVRVLSVVPRDAVDIRDGSEEPFSAIQARHSRSRLEFTLATVSFGFAVLLATIAAFRGVTLYRGGRTTSTRHITADAALRSAVAELSRTERTVRDGWSDESLARVLAALRVATAAATGLPVAQVMTAPGQSPGEGQILAHSGLVRRKRFFISAALRSELTDSRGPTDRRFASGRDAQLGSLQASTDVVLKARYGRAGVVDQAPLNASLEEGLRAVRQLRRRRWWRLPRIGRNTVEGRATQGGLG